MSSISFFGLENTILYSITKSDLRDVVRFYNVSDRHFLICMNNLNDKENSDFLRLRVYYVVVLWLHTMIERLRCRRKVHETIVCTRRL